MTVCFISAYVNGFDVTRCIVLFSWQIPLSLEFYSCTHFCLRFVNVLLKRKILFNTLQWSVRIFVLEFFPIISLFQCTLCSTYVIIVIYFKILFTSPTAATKCQSIKSSCCSQTGFFMLNWRRWVNHTLVWYHRKCSDMYLGKHMC